MESHQERKFEGAQLFRVGRLRVTSMTFIGEQEIPMHDHPHSQGLILVFRGAVEISVCEKIPYPEDTPFSRLRILSKRRLFPGGISRISMKKGNIHAFRTLSKKCLLLDVMLHERTNILRNWFFPVHQLESNGKVILAHTIIRKYLPDAGVTADQVTTAIHQGGNDEKTRILSH